MIKREVVKKTNQVKLTFVQPYHGSQPRTSVVGDFNNWNPKVNPLVKRANGTASASVILEPGQKVRFRYCTAEGQWFNDEDADTYEPGEYGAENCVVVI